MKKILFLILISFGWLFLGAQSVQEANQYLYYERYQSAEQTLHNVLKNDPQNEEAWYVLSRAYLLQAESQKAYDSLRAAPIPVLSSPFYKVALGSVLLHQKNTEEATRYFNQALEQTRQKDARIFTAIADAHIMAPNGNANYAVEMMEKAIRQDRKNEWLYVKLGDAYRKMHNGTEAYKAYTKAIDLNKNHAAAYHKLGEIFVTQKNVDLYLENFNKAMNADPNYAPALYRLYLYEFYRDPAKAMQYYHLYKMKSDASIQHDYDMADLYYLNKNYQSAIDLARKIVDVEGNEVQPRLYKLLGYSLAGINDTAKAIDYMQQYFASEEDSNQIAKDFETMAAFYESKGHVDSAITHYESAVEKALATEGTDSLLLNTYYKSLADLSKKTEDFDRQARWLGMYYSSSAQATNVDLFNWGLAHYRAENYQMADSVFEMYTEKYPEQGFGYYWQARSLALIDSNMTEGLAIPVYEKLINVLQADSAETNNKKWMVEAYGYLAAYEANTQKNYQKAISYFERILELDPANDDAKRYIAVLQKSIGNTGSN